MAKIRKTSKFTMGIIILGGIISGLTLGIVIAVGSDLPQVQSLEDFEPGAATRIYSSDDFLLAEIFTEKRHPLRLEEIPQNLKLAVIAVEDRRFFKHPGTDFIRIAGALIRDVISMRFAQGGSTITQQLAKNLFLTNEKTLTRKLREIFIAWQIERRYTKEEILTLYLNKIPFGAGAYGVSAAADLFFGKKVSELTLGECTLLAGLPQGPELYEPTKYPERAKARRNVVLNAMVREGYITSSQAKEADAEPLKLRFDSSGRKNRAPQFIAQVKQRLVETLGENAVYKGGLEVKTTLSLKMQEYARRSVESGLSAFRAQYAEKYGEGVLPVNAIIIAMDAGSGRVCAWYGTNDHERPQHDSIISQSIVPGALIGTFIHTAAIESGLTQADIVWDAPINYKIKEDGLWAPQNISGKYEGEITLRRALVSSGSIPAAKILSRIGIDKTTSIARKLGITSQLPRDVTLASGRSPVNILEMLTAYHTIAEGGLWVEPSFIIEVKDRSGRIIYRPAPKSKAVLTPETAFIITDMLKGALAVNIHRPENEQEYSFMAGNHGASSSGDSSAFFGYSPSVAAGVWVEFSPDADVDIYRRQLKPSLPVWLDFMALSARDGGPKTFKKPSGVIMADMDIFSGKSGVAGEPGVVSAAFRAGTEPEKQTGRDRELP